MVGRSPGRGASATSPPGAVSSPMPAPPEACCVLPAPLTAAPDRPQACSTSAVPAVRPCQQSGNSASPSPTLSTRSTLPTTSKPWPKGYRWLQRSAQAQKRGLATGVLACVHARACVGVCMCVHGMCPLQLTHAVTQATCLPDDRRLGSRAAAATAAVTSAATATATALLLTSILQPRSEPPPAAIAARVKLVNWEARLVQVCSGAASWQGSRQAVRPTRLNSTKQLHVRVAPMPLGPPVYSRPAVGIRAVGVDCP